MSEDLHKNIFSSPQGDPPGPEKLEAYYKGELSERERYEIEKFLLEDELTAEALEGLGEEINSDATRTAVADLTGRAWKRVGEEQKRRRRGAATWMAVASAVILLVVGTWFFINQSENKKMDKVFAENFEVFPGDDSAPAEPQLEGLKKEELEEKKEGGLLAAANKPDEQNRLSPPPAPTMRDEDGIFQREELEGKDEVLDNRPKRENNVNELSPNDFLASNEEPVEEIVEEEADLGMLDEEITGELGGEFDKEYKVAAPNMQEKADENFNMDVGGSMYGGAPQQDRGEVVKSEDKTALEDQKQLEQTVADPGFAMDDLEVAESEEGIELDEFVITGYDGKQSERRNKGLKSKKANRAVTAATTGVNAPEMSKDMDDLAKNEEMSNERYQEGMDLYRKQDFKGASGKFEQAADLNQEEADARFYAGVSYLSAGQAKEALENLEKVKSGDERYEDALWYRALAHIKLKEKKKAKKLLTKLQKGSKYEERATNMLNAF